MQHLMSPGSFGQNPDWEDPPPELQLAVLIQTPGVPLAEHGPLTAARPSGSKNSMMELDSMLVEMLISRGGFSKKRQRPSEIR